MDTHAEPPVDIARLQGISDGDREFEQEVIAAYIDDITERIVRLDTAIATGDTENARRDAHTIKGASSNVGTTRLQEMGHQLEKLDIIAEKDAAIRLLEEIRKEFAAVKSYFENYLSR